MKGRATKRPDELRPEYKFDYGKAVRGKYYKRLLEERANVVVLEPDVATAFRDSASVNEALKSLLDLTRSNRRLTKRSSRRHKGLRPAIPGTLYLMLSAMRCRERRV